MKKILIAAIMITLAGCGPRVTSDNTIKDFQQNIKYFADKSHDTCFAVVESYSTSGNWVTMLTSVPCDKLTPQERGEVQK